METGSPRVRARSRKKRCYELAFKGMEQAPEWTLVHGTISLDCAPDFPIGHAWLEHNGELYDAVHDKFYSVEAYKHEWRAHVTRRYTLQEACECVIATNVYGPWD